MKFTENMQQVAALQPDYLGFIFYEKSKRNFEGIIPELPKEIKKTGVFVNEYIEIVVSLVEEYRLDAIQLHGDESVSYILDLKQQLANNRALFIEENKQIKKKKNQHYISKKEVDFILDVPSPIGTVTYFAKARNKKKSVEGDISTAYVEGQLSGLPVMYISPGDIPKKLESILPEKYKNLKVLKL